MGDRNRKRLGDKILYFLIRLQNREKIHVCKDYTCLQVD